jgi:hypothetical protein
MEMGSVAAAVAPGAGNSVMTAVSATSSRFANNMNNDNCLTKSCNACLSTKVIGPEEINVYPDCLINEIQLNIFPPSATFTKASTSIAGGGGKNQQKNYYDNVDNSAPQGNCLSIDVFENKKCNESSREDKSVGSFSHISFKRSDSILHISIGNSSKIIKRNKRKRRWFFTKLYKLSRRSSTTKDEMYLSPQCCCAQERCGSYHLNNAQSLNIVNDSLVITINKKSHAANNTMTENESHVNSFRMLDGDLAYGANELDFYMNEIKKRENRVRYETSNRN